MAKKKSKNKPATQILITLEAEMHLHDGEPHRWVDVSAKRGNHGWSTRVRVRTIEDSLVPIMSDAHDALFQLEHGASQVELSERMSAPIEESQDEEVQTYHDEQYVIAEYHPTGLESFEEEDYDQYAERADEDLDETQTEIIVHDSQQSLF